MSLTPNPKLSVGTGNTGGGFNVTHGAPGYAERIYQPFVGYGPAYAPRTNENRTTYTGGMTPGFDGAEFIGYRTHTLNSARHATFVYTNTQNRRDSEWQQTSFPASRRNLTLAQVPQKYVVGRAVIPARPQSGANYFLGYVPTTVRYGASSTSAPLGS